MKVTLVLVAALLVVSAVGFRLGRAKAAALGRGRQAALRALPDYYGYWVVVWCILPPLVVLVVWLALEPALLRAMVVASLPESSRSLSAARLDLLVNDIRNLAADNGVDSPADPALRQIAADYAVMAGIAQFAMAAVVISVAVAGLTWARSRIAPGLRARDAVERVVHVLLIAGASVAVLTTVGIVLSLMFEAARFFAQVSPLEFLFGLQWSPQIALRPDQVGASGVFGAVPLFAGTLLITAIAMCVAMPIGLMSAIYMAEYAPPRFRNIAKPLLELLAGIPTVVYGFFAVLAVAPFFRGLGAAPGLEIASESALAAGVVMGIMLVPFVSSLSDDVITAVPKGLREGSYGLGATRSETIRRVVLPAALPGIAGGFLLAVSRAIGETMVVLMAAGLAANLTADPFEAVTTVTSQIATLLVGDPSFDSPKTLAAFALGLVLFCVTLLLNIVALQIVRRYREQYE